MSSADRIQVVNAVLWVEFLTMCRIILHSFTEYTAQPEHQGAQGNAELRSKPEESWSVRHQPKSTLKTLSGFVLIKLELLQLVVGFTHRLVPFEKCKATLLGPGRAVSAMSNIPYNQKMH